MPRRIASLDGVRGFAILLVMFHHFTVLTPRSRPEFFWTELAEMGRYGVDLFFVLSGFLITGILLASRSSERYFQTFYIRRALRIFPLFYAVVIFSLAVLPWLIGFLPPSLGDVIRQKTEAAHWLWYAGYGTNFLIALQNKYTHGILDVTWSLAIEEHFYLVWPAVVFSLKEGGLKRTCVWVMVGSLALRAILWHAGFSRLQIYMLTFTRIDMLMFGALLALLADEGRHSLPAKYLSFRKPLFVTLGALIAALAAPGFFDYSSPIMNTVGYTLMGFFFMLLVDLCVDPEDAPGIEKFFSAGALRFFGKYSYALYLFHLPAAYFTQYILFRGADFHSLPGLAIMWQFIFYLAASVISVAAALLSWNLLEKPVLSLKDKFAY